MAEQGFAQLLVDPPEQLLGLFERLLAETYLFHELRLPAVQGDQMSDVGVVFHCGQASALGTEVWTKRAYLRSVPLPMHFPGAAKRGLRLVAVSAILPFGP